MERDKILKAIMERYGSISTLKMAMYECTDTVLVNLEDDLEYEVSESKILELLWMQVKGTI